MQFEVNAPILMETHLKISKVVDGDSIKVTSIFNTNEKEIRLYGIDAPEIKICRKLRDDEKKVHLAGEFMMFLAQLSTRYLLSVAPPGTKVTLITEQDNRLDIYKRQLAYVILPDGSCLNELMLSEGYARAASEYYCSKLADFQILNFAAMQAGQGLYACTPNF